MMKSLFAASVCVLALFLHVSGKVVRKASDTVVNIEVASDGELAQHGTADVDAGACNFKRRLKWTLNASTVYRSNMAGYGPNFTEGNIRPNIRYECVGRRPNGECFDLLMRNTSDYNNYSVPCASSQCEGDLDLGAGIGLESRILLQDSQQGSQYFGGVHLGTAQGGKYKVGKHGTTMEISFVQHQKCIPLPDAEGPFVILIGDIDSDNRKVGGKKVIHAYDTVEIIDEPCKAYMVKEDPRKNARIKFYTGHNPDQIIPRPTKFTSGLGFSGKGVGERNVLNDRLAFTALYPHAKFYVHFGMTIPKGTNLTMLDASRIFSIRPEFPEKLKSPDMDVFGMR